MDMTMLLWYRYDPVSDMWTELQAMSRCRVLACSVVYHDRIYVIGECTYIVCCWLEDQGTMHHKPDQSVCSLKPKRCNPSQSLRKQTQTCRYISRWQRNASIVHSSLRRDGSVYVVRSLCSNRESSVTDSHVRGGGGMTRLPDDVAHSVDWHGVWATDVGRSEMYVPSNDLWDPASIQMSLTSASLRCARQCLSTQTAERAACRTIVSMGMSAATPLDTALVAWDHWNVSVTCDKFNISNDYWVNGLLMQYFEQVFSVGVSVVCKTAIKIRFFHSKLIFHNLNPALKPADNDWLAQMSFFHTHLMAHRQLNHSLA